MVTFATLPRHLARTLQGEIERSGIPAFVFRSGPLDLDARDEERDWDLLLPASAEEAARERFAQRRDTLLVDAAAWRAAGMPTPPFVPAPLPPQPNEVVQ